jgi:hypothetical protein
VLMDQHVGDYLPCRTAALFGVDAHPHSVLVGDTPSVAGGELPRRQADPNYTRTRPRESHG